MEISAPSRLTVIGGTRVNLFSLLREMVRRLEPGSQKPSRDLLVDEMEMGVLRRPTCTVREIINQRREVIFGRKDHGIKDEPLALTVLELFGSFRVPESEMEAFEQLSRLYDTLDVDFNAMDVQVILWRRLRPISWQRNTELALSLPTSTCWFKCCITTTSVIYDRKKVVRALLLLQKKLRDKRNREILSRLNPDQIPSLIGEKQEGNIPYKTWPRPPTLLKYFEFVSMTLKKLAFLGFGFSSISEESHA